MRLISTGVMAAGIAIVAIFGGSICAAGGPATHPDYLERTQSRTLGNVRVSAAALSAEESEAVYGAPLGDKLIQPVWVEVENKEDVAYWLMSPGLDPNFFPASEAAEAMALDDPARRPG